MAEFILQDMVKAYQGRQVLHINQLELESGKIYSVLGPNGAGKSTLLKILNFLEIPTSGKLYFLEQDVGAIDEKARLNLQRQMCRCCKIHTCFTGQ